MAVLGRVLHSFPFLLTGRRGPRAKAWSLLTCTRGSVSLMGARAKAWCLLIQPEASLLHGTQGRDTGGTLSASSHTQKRLSRSLVLLNFTLSMDNCQCPSQWPVVSRTKQLKLS